MSTLKKQIVYYKTKPYNYNSKFFPFFDSIGMIYNIFYVTCASPETGPHYVSIINRNGVRILGVG